MNLTHADDERRRFDAVEAVLREIRPAMEADAGGVDLVSIDDGAVTVRFKGTCLDCPSSPLTLRYGIEMTLRSKLPWVTKVRRITDK
jgi:Fe-S cluster biogenesis protein NfuA